MKQLLRIFILAVLSLFFAAPFSYAQSKAPAGSAESSSGQAVNLTAKAAVLIEGNSGEIILEKNKDTELVPASITKIMTLTLIMEALEEGKIQLTDSVSVPGNRRCSVFAFPFVFGAVASRPFLFSAILAPALLEF